MKIVLADGRRRDIPFMGYIVPVLSGILIAFGAAYPVLTLGCFLINLIYVFYAQPKEIYRLLFMLLPFAQVYKVLSVTTISLFTVLELFAIAMMILRRKKVERTFLILLLVWAVFVLLGSHQDYFLWIKQIAIPLLIYLFFRHEQLDFKELVISLTVGLLLSSLFAVFKESIPNLADMVRATRNWEAEGIVYRFSGLYPDPNYYTTIIILCSVSFLTMYACRTMGWEALALFAVLTICGAETGSKSYLLMLCGILGLFTICLFATKRYILGVLACAAVAFFCIAIFAGKIELFNNILIRLQSDNLTTGRADTWDTYIKYIDANWPRWLVGCGVGAGYVNQIAPHNTYLDFLYYYGIVGTLFWFALCINAVGKKQIPNIYIGSLSLICLLVMIVFLSSMIFFDFAFTIIFVVYALRTDFQKRPMKKRAA